METHETEQHLAKFENRLITKEAFVVGAALATTPVVVSYAVIKSTGDAVRSFADDLSTAFNNRVDSSRTFGSPIRKEVSLREKTINELASAGKLITKAVKSKPIKRGT